MKATLPLTFILLLMQVYKLSATVFYVSAGSLNPTPPYTTWATAATNIQDAVDAAPSGGWVLVTNGVYAGGVVVGKPLVLTSINGAQSTIINGGGTNRCLSLSNGGWLWGLTFTNGYADTGAGVLCTATNSFLTNCVFTGNSAGTGGGVYGATLYNCLLTGNTARGNGSGGAAAYSTLYNCTVSGNSAAQAGGVFQSTLYNCVVYDNTAASGPNFSLSTLNYCCTIPLPASGVGNITNAPLFVNEGSGDFRLQAGSPCIDAGNNAYRTAFGLITVDLAGNPRIAGAAVDMGAYEYSGAGSGMGGSYVMNFQFSGFAPSNGNPAPTDPVIGSISWRAASINGPIQGFDSISLTLDGHTYSPNELHYRFDPNPDFSKTQIYSNPLGPLLGSLTDEFYLAWDRVSLQASAFVYSSSRRSGIWEASSFISFSLSSHAEPFIATQPLSQTVVAGTNVSFSAGASGSPPLYWQWMFNGNPIQDATNSSLQLQSITLGQAGTYSVIVSNVLGVTTSSNATLTVLLAGTKYVWQGSPSPTAPYTNWTTAAHGIQEAVDVSVAGDTLLVTNGIYASGWRTVDYEQNRVIVPLPVALRSVNGPQVTIIDGSGTNRCVLLTNGSLLSGFTLTNGVATFRGGGGVSGGLLTNCVLAGNRAAVGGGALNCTLHSCLLTGNSISGATNGCGAAHCTLYNCILLGNSGAMSAVVDSCDLYSCLVISNSAVGANLSTLYNCALIANQGGGVLGGTLHNCTLAENGSYSGASESTLLNCIVYYNFAAGGQNYDAFSCTLEYCCTTPMPDSGLGNFTNAPLFIDVAGGDFRLQRNSPCINAGNNALVIGATDLDGNPRISGGTVDIGAYELEFSGSPLITVQPSDQIVYSGSDATFTARAVGLWPLSWQWSFNGNAIPNATNADLTLPTVTIDEAGAYSVVVTNVLGTATSREALLSLQKPTINYVWQGSPSPTPPYTEWTTAAHSIQDAVNAAGSSGQILVTNGVYAGGLDVSKPLSLRSVNGPQFTIIDGGGTNRCIVMTSGSSLSGFTLTNGFADSGAGVLSYYPGTGLLTNCVLAGNRASGNAAGAKYCTLSNCTLTGNSGETDGSAAAFCTLYNCRITGTSGSSGAAAFQCNLYSCAVTYNSVGGVNDSTLYNCTVVGNYGFGVWFGRLYSCNVVSNQGVGVFFGTLYNSIAYYNSSSSGTSNYFDYWCNFDHSCTTPLPSYGVGVITNAPLFVDPAKGNFHLQADSPCINAGNNLFAYSAADLDGNPRVVGGTVDIGAYEFQGTGSPAFYGWLQSYGLPIDGSADYTDPDGDGMNNWQEWVCATNPTNAVSCLRLLTAAPTSTSVTLTWQSVAGMSYFLERATNLVATFTWVSSNIVGQAATTSYADTNAIGAGPFFYRVGVNHP